MFESENGDFDIQKTHLNNKGEIVISSGETNLGIIGKTDVKAKIFEKNTLTCDMFGNVYYRSFPYKMVTHARVFNLKAKFNINDKIGLYLVGIFSFIKFKFSYSSMASWKKIKNEVINLPTDSKGNLAFDFMESYIAELEAERVRELEAERVRELEAYLRATGLSNYTLTKKEELALNIISDTNRGGERGIIPLVA